MGKQWKQCQTLFSGVPKSLQISWGKNPGVVCHSLVQWTLFCQNSSLWPIHLGGPAQQVSRLHRVTQAPLPRQGCDSLRGSWLDLWSSWLCGGNREWVEKEMATHSSILAWEIPRTEEGCPEPGGLQSMGLQRVRCGLATEHTLTQW